MLLATIDPHRVLRSHTKRVPEYQCKLRHLFSLLAQLQESGLACQWLHQLRNPVQDALVLLRHADFCVRLHIVGWAAGRDDVVARKSGAIVPGGGDAVVVLLLGCGCGGRGCLCLGLRLCLELAVLAYMVMRLLVVTLRPLAWVLLLLVREDMLHLLLIPVVLSDLSGSCCCVGEQEEVACDVLPK